MEQPLVSILIPVIGNATYLELALTSALLQTYTNIEIIIRDPTPTDKIQILLEKEFLPYSNKINYIKDTRYMSRLEILNELLRLSNGTYASFLMEKDLFYPTKIETMMNYFLKDITNSLKLITSNKKIINMHGNLIEDVNGIDNIVRTNLNWESTISSNLILKQPNYIGGLSTPLFRKKDLILPFGSYAGHQFIKEIELASWLTLVSQGSLVVIAEELIFERQNFGGKIKMDLVIDWINFIKLIKKQGCIITKSTEYGIIKKILGWIDYLLINCKNSYSKIEQEQLHEYKNYLQFL